MRGKKTIYTSEFDALRSDLNYLQNRYSDLNYEVERLREKYAKDERFAKHFVFWIASFILSASLANLIVIVSYWFIMAVPLFVVTIYLIKQNLLRRGE